jgi:hypothetical protein
MLCIAKRRAKCGLSATVRTIINVSSVTFKLDKLDQLDQLDQLSFESAFKDTC